MRHDGLFRHDFGLIALAKHRRDTRKHAGAQAQLAVVDASPHPHRAAIGVNQRVNSLDESHKTAARQRIQIDHGGLAFFDFVLETLWQTEVNKNSVNVLHIHDIGAVLEVIPHIGRANANDAIKRREDFQACRCGFGQSQLGLGHLQIGRTFIDRTLADEILFH